MLAAYSQSIPPNPVPFQMNFLPHPTKRYCSVLFLLALSALGSFWFAAKTASAIDRSPSGLDVTEIAFFDPKVPDYQNLIDGTRGGVEVVLLDKNRNGLEQIAEKLRGCSGLSAIHIISHGNTGRLFLGNIEIAEKDLDTYSAELEAIRRSLRIGGDLLFYGCNLAAGEAGRTFVAELASRTSADVAASTDPTGPEILGGDWELETGGSSIDVALAIGESAQTNYTAGILGFTTGQFLTGSANTNNYGATAVSPAGTIYGLWSYAVYPDSGNIKFATWNGSSWTELPGSAVTGNLVGTQLGSLNLANSFGVNSFAVDSNEDIHAIFSLGVQNGGSGGERGIVYGKFDSSMQTWTFRRIFIVQLSNGYRNLVSAALALDSAENPHIVFAWSDVTSPGNYYLQYAYFNGMSWNASGTTNAFDAEAIDSISGDDNINGVDAAFDSSGNLHVSYVKNDPGSGATSGDAWYVKRTGSTWGTPAEVADINGLYYTSIAVDSNNKVHIAFAEDTSTTQTTLRIVSDVSGSFASSSAGIIDAPMGTDYFDSPYDVNISINSLNQRVLSAGYAAYDTMFNVLKEAVVVSSETSPGMWTIEDALLGTSSAGSFTANAMSLKDDNTVAILVGTRNDAYTSGDLRFAVGVPNALGSVSTTPVIGVAEKVTVSGSQTTFDFYLENLGDAELQSLTLPFNLDSVFGAGSYSVTSGPSFIDDPGTITLSGAFNGSGSTALITSGTLAVGDTAQIRVVVQVGQLTDQGSGLGVYSSQVTASAQSSGGDMTTDLSDNGTNPDPSGNDDPTDAGEDDPTPITIAQAPVIGVAKNASVSGQTVTLDFYLENFGNVTLQSLSLIDDFDAVFGAGNFTVASGPTFVDDPGTITLNASFDGSTTTQLISSGTLAYGDTAQIRVVVDTYALQDSGSGLGVYSNQVTAAAQSPDNTMTSDTSDSGTDPDPDGDGNPNEAGENDATPVTIPERPVIGVAKDVSITGRFATVDLYLENFGNVELQQVSLPVDLDAVFGAGNYSIASAPSLIDDPGTLTLNGSFNGSGSTDLLVPGSSTLPFADTAQIRLVVQVTTVTDQGFGIGVYQCQVTAAAESPGGTMTSDLSDSGTDPDPNGNGDPTEAGENDSNSVTLKGSVGDLVWDDLDGDGIRDGGEPGLIGVTVFLDLNTNSMLDGGEPTDVTDASGNYSIDDVPAGTYSVLVDTTTVPAGYALTSGTNPMNVTLFAGEQNTDIDFAFSLPETPSLEVTIVDDVVNAFDEETSTREALDYAAMLGGSQTVTFDPALFSGGMATFPIATPLTVTSSVTIEGPGGDMLEFDGGSTSTLFIIDDSTGTDQTVIFTGFTIRNGTSPAGSGVGGAIINAEDLTLANLTIADNQSADAAGGVYSSGALTVVNSLVANNTGNTTGGIFHEGTGILTIVNSTISGNTGTSAGGISVNGTGGANLFGNVTITGQTGPAVELASGVTLNISNSIVAGNGDGDFTGVAGATVVSNSANFIGDPQGEAAFSSDANFVSTATAIGDVLNTTLADNGGLTMTHALVPGSPAIDGGLNSDIPADSADADGNMNTAEPSPFDQRGTGFDRVVMGDPASGSAIVDMGAFELFAPPTFNADLYSIASTSGPVDLLALTGATPDDGAFFGTGVAGSIFDPSGLPPGQYVISYTITDSFGVMNQNSFTIDLFTSLFRPDLRYGTRGNSGAHKGNNQYGGGQTLRAETNRSKLRLFFSVENDGNIPDLLRSQAKGIAKSRFKTRIVERGGAGNVTGAFLRGGYVRKFDSGEVAIYKVIVKTKDRFRSTNLGARWLVTSESDRSKQDINRVKVRFESRYVKPPDLYR